MWAQNIQVRQKDPSLVNPKALGTCLVAFSLEPVLLTEVQQRLSFSCI